MSEIKVHDNIGSLIADPDTVQAALELLASLEKLRVVLTVNGQSFEGVIKFGEQNAVIEVVIAV